MIAVHVAFWACLGLLTWVYAGYPLVALVYGRLRPVRLLPAREDIRRVSVGLAVHDAATQLVPRIADIVAQQPPLELEIIVASDGSRDETVAVGQRLAATDDRIRVLDLPRLGQSAAQSAIFDAASADVVVLTDAETRFGPGALAALVVPLADTRVGCVTGVLSWRYDAQTGTARHEGLYWRYEQAVRAWESRAGWLSAGTGALLAVRRSMFRPAPAHASLDQMLPLYTVQAGALVLVSPTAVGTDRGPATLAEQFASRVRIATQGIAANLRMSLHIRPWRRPGSFLAIWSHKLLRWATPILLMVAALAGLAIAVAEAAPLYLLPAGSAAVLVILGIVGYLGHRVGRRIPLTGFPLTVLSVNLAFALAWVNVVIGRRVRAWRPDRHGPDPQRPDPHRPGIGRA